jgi:hypothetical protein
VNVTSGDIYKNSNQCPSCGMKMPRDSCMLWDIYKYRADANCKEFIMNCISKDLPAKDILEKLGKEEGMTIGRLREEHSNWRKYRY